MWIKRLLGAIRELRRDYARASDAEEAARYQLTRSARRFARRTQASTDKLTFSAALMRAGEVGAASRMVEDLERDVKAEEAALMEQMNEVKLARAVRREKMARMRLTIALASALLGAGLLSLSAAALAVGSFIAERHGSGPVGAQSGPGRAPPSGAPITTSTSHARQFTESSDIVVRLIAGGKVVMSPAQFRRYNELVSSRASEEDFESFLARLLPGDRAEVISRVLAASVGGAREATGAAQRAAGTEAARAAERKEVRPGLPDGPGEQAPADEAEGGSPGPRSSASPTPSSSNPHRNWTEGPITDPGAADRGDLPPEPVGRD
jgi:hypothetical protein